MKPNKRVSKDHCTRWHEKMIKDWRDEIEIGDILLTPSGLERTIRDALYFSDGFIICVELSILRCSWTGRATTVLNRSDLKQRQFRPSGYRWSDWNELDRAIEKEILVIKSPPQLTCCDVVGVTQ